MLRPARHRGCHPVRMLLKEAAMTSTDITAALAVEHARDLRRTADRNRLVALARCCRPAAIAAGWRRIHAWVDRGQLQQVTGSPCRV